LLRVVQLKHLILAGSDYIDKIWGTKLRERLRTVKYRRELFRLHLYNWRIYRHAQVFGFIQIETYSPCNRRCSCCPVGYKKRRVTRMSDSLFRRIIDQLAERNYQGEIALHFYNEPLLEKRLPNFISYAHQKCPKSFIYFASNGDYLTIEMFRELIKRGLSQLVLSQYDPVPKERLRIFLESADDNDWKYFTFERKVVEEYTWSNRAGSIPKWRINEPLKQRCTRPEVQMIINAQGQVPLCCNDYFGEESLGDVSRENVFDIWNSKRAKEIRSHLRKANRHKIKLCSGCDWHNEGVRYSRKRTAYDTDRAPWSPADFDYRRPVSRSYRA